MELSTGDDIYSSIKGLRINEFCVKKSDYGNNIFFDKKKNPFTSVHIF